MIQWTPKLNGPCRRHFFLFFYFSFNFIFIAHLRISVLLCATIKTMLNLRFSNALTWLSLFPKQPVKGSSMAQSAGTVEYTDCISAEGVRLPNECPDIYDTKQSDGEVPVILTLWGIRSTPLLSSFPGPLWPGVVEPDRVLSMGQIEVFDV